MFPVSEDFITAIKARSRDYLKWFGTITLTSGQSYEYTDSDIISGTGVLTRSCSSDASIDIGTVYAAELKMSLLPSERFDVDRYQVSKAVIDLWCKVPLKTEIYTWGEAAPYTWIELSDTLWGDNPKNINERIPMGVFTVSEAMRSNNALKITAYDNMTKFDKALPTLDSTARTTYQWLTYICTACNVTLGMTHKEVNALPNGGRYVSFADVNNETTTYRDLLANLAVTLAAVAVMDRYGRLVLKKYTMNIVDTIDSAFRYSSDFSDYQSYYTGIRAEYKAEGLSEYFTNTVSDNGLVYDLGYNTFLQISNTYNRQSALKNIINAQAGIKYAPFSVSMPTNPAYDPMDVLEFTDNQTGDEDIAPITRQIFNIGGKMDIFCGGTDPALTDVKTRETKAIEELSSQVSMGGSLLGADAWILIDSYPDEAVTITSTDVETTSLEITTSTNTARTQIAWTGFYTLSADATVTATVMVDSTVVYTASDLQIAGVNTFTVITGYDIIGKGKHTVHVKLKAEDVAS